MHYWAETSHFIIAASDVAGPAVEGEYWLSCQSLGIKQNNTVGSEVVYGVSAPNCNTNALEVPAAGRYELFQLSNELIYTIPLANFDGLNCKEALGELAAPIDYIYGFDHSGDYHFRVRPTTAVSNYKIVDTEDGIAYPDTTAGHIYNIPAHIKIKTSGYGNVGNYVAVRSSTISLGKVGGQGTFVERPEGHQGFQCDLEANQTDDLAHQVILECIKAGLPASYDPTTNPNYPQALFRGYIYQSEIQTELAKDHAASATAIDIVDSGYEGMGISPGDFIVIGDDAINRIDGDYADVTINANYVTVNVETGLAQAYDAGTKVVVYKKAHTYTTDGTYGVTELQAGLADASGTGQTVYVEDGSNISVGTVLKINTEAMVVEAIEEDSSNSRWTLTCYRGSHRSPTATHSAGDTVLAYFAFSAEDKQYGVFGTNITLGCYPNSSLTDATEVAQSKTFLVGDRIRIEAPGLQLSRSGSVATAEDKSSQSIYSGGRRKEYTGPRARHDRFMNHVLANELVKTILADEAYPHPILTASIPFMFHIFEPGDRVPVVSRRYFKQATSYTVECEVINIALTPPSGINPDGQTIWELRAVNSYDW